MCREKATGGKQAQKKCVLLLLGIALAIGGITIIYNMERHHEAEMQAQEQKLGEEIFQEALAYIDIKNYKSAFDLLNELPSDFILRDLDRWEISKLCTYLDIQMTYDSNDFDVVQTALKRLENIDGKDFSNISNSLSSEIDMFKKEVAEQCNYLMQIEYEGVIPYVGMSESLLYYTEWGQPIKIVEKGLITDIEKYFFYKVDGHIYCARTRRWRRDEEGAGEVENVWLVYKKSESEIGLIPYELIE